MSTSPDYVLKALNKITGDKTGKIGVAWKNEDGTLTLALDMLINLSSDKNIVLKLFPYDPVWSGKTASSKPAPGKRKSKKNSIKDSPVSVVNRI